MALEGSDMNAMLCSFFLSCTWHKKIFKEIDELQCDADYGKLKGARYIPELCDILFISYESIKQARL